MAVLLIDFIKTVSKFDSWNQISKIRFFAWFIHDKLGRDRFQPGDITECFRQLQIHPPNVSQFLKVMSEREPREVTKDSRGYYLMRHVAEPLRLKYGHVADSTPRTEKVLPSSVVANTRGWYVKLIQQANGCYEHEWYDACSVMIRKFVEFLIIEVYEAHKKEAQ